MPRPLILGLAGVCVFAVIAAAMISVMPEPLKASDYLVAGSVATLVSLLVCFLVVIASSRSRNVFFKRRKK
jgi:hypothetical protein